ncbi:hypothetical protein Sjap_022787 [Stephania japonica]|uniref:Uncharacterized protein n=1 Tax=Stephania japonica TaxID=461633 RepID=A0AAP0HV99_9MAGN
MSSLALGGLLSRLEQPPPPPLTTSPELEIIVGCRTRIPSHERSRTRDCFQDMERGLRTLREVLDVAKLAIVVNI